MFSSTPVDAIQPGWASEVGVGARVGSTVAVGAPTVGVGDDGERGIFRIGIIGASGTGPCVIIG